MVGLNGGPKCGVTILAGEYYGGCRIRGSGVKTTSPRISDIDLPKRDSPKAMGPNSYYLDLEIEVPELGSKLK